MRYDLSYIVTYFFLDVFSLWEKKSDLLGHSRNSYDTSQRVVGFRTVRVYYEKVCFLCTLSLYALRQRISRPPHLRNRD